MLCRASPSRDGVNPLRAPRNPTRSARVESRVIRTMLGEVAAPRPGKPRMRQNQRTQKEQPTNHASQCNASTVPTKLPGQIAQRCSPETDVLTAPIRYNGSFHGNPGGPTPLNKSAWLLAGLLLTGIATIPACRNQSHWQGNHKLIILGIDGMDPQLSEDSCRKARCPTSPVSLSKVLSELCHQHPSAESGRMVELDHWHERRRPWDFRFHPS